MSLMVIYVLTYIGKNGSNSNHPGNDSGTRSKTSGVLSSQTMNSNSVLSMDSIGKGMYIYVFICACMYMCMFIYIYIYKYAIHMNIYM
jgi:hypothetical protein